MAVGNLGATLNLIEGFLASDFAAASYNRTQGTALLVDMIRQVASRADLTYSNLRVYPPTLFDGTNDVDVESGAVGLIAIIAGTNSSAAEDEAVVVYENNTVDETTTRPIAVLNVDAGASTATGRVYSVVFPEPVVMAALSYSVIDNGANGDIQAGTALGDANGTKVMLVYAE